MNRFKKRKIYIIAWLAAVCLLAETTMQPIFASQVSADQMSADQAVNETKDAVDTAEVSADETEASADLTELPAQESEGAAEQTARPDEEGLDQAQAQADSISAEQPSVPAEQLELPLEETGEQAIQLAAGQTVTGSFAAVSGKDVATIRYYTNQEKTEYAFADFSYNSSTGKYEYSFSAPYNNFTVAQGSENVRETYQGNATVIAEYFSTAKWDGAVDVSWYNETSKDFYIDTPAKLAGVAAVVNGAVDGQTKDYQIKGDAAKYINGTQKSDADLIGGAKGTAVIGLAAHDFSNRTIHITADLNMGGADGSAITHTGKNDTVNSYDYPNWMPIGCEVAADPADETTMVLSAFNGVLDGGGHHITNLYCYRYTYAGWQYSQGTGLVGCLGVLYDGEKSPALTPAVRNLSLSGYVYGRRMVGGIVGVTGGGSNSVEGESVDRSLLENLANHAWVYSTDSKGVGGIVASAYVNDGSIINCYNDGQISTIYAAPAGGIVGANEHMDVFACYNRGTIDTGKIHYGRGIGGTGNSPGNFTVDTCYYLKGSGDDTSYPGYYTYNLPSSVKVNVTEMTDAQMKNGSLLEKLNVNGTAYVTGDSGYPVLAWEKGSGSGSLTVTNPEGGKVSASATGKIANGTVVYLSSTQDTGWNFRYFTWNGKEMTGDYVTVNGDTKVSAYLESSKAGVLQIKQNTVCDVTVKKNGLALENGQLKEVKNYPVAVGDPLYEGDQLMVTAKLKSGQVPSDPNMDYKASVGAANPYIYGFTYTGSEEETYSSPIFTVDARINTDEVSLTLDVTADTTPKLWKYIPDKSWYTGKQTSYTISNATQLAGLDALVEEGNTFDGITILLGKDISLKNTDGTSGSRGWDGIGNTEYAFRGIFDGQGHTVRDMNGVRTGLFASAKGSSVSSTAQIKNVTVYGTATGQNASGIAGEAQFTKISGCNSYVVIADGIGYTAGILGRDLNGSSVESCVNYGSVKGTGRVAGIAGNISAKGSITDCINKGHITASTTGANQIGGVAGDLSGAMLRCANYGNVTAGGRNIGGLVAMATVETSVITDCCNVGKVVYKSGTNSLDSAGGLIGYGSIYRITNCHQYGSVTASDNAVSKHVGSFIGRHLANSSSSISNVSVLNTAQADGIVADGKTLAQLKAESSSFYGSLSEADAASFKKTSGVLAVINGNQSFVLTNGTYPELKAVASTHVHKGGTATCSDLAVCDSCGLQYGELNPTKHTDTEIRGAKDAVWVYEGYTGDTYCADCGTLLEKGKTIAAQPNRNAVTVTIKITGKADQTKKYTMAQFDKLKTTGKPIGYMFGFKSTTIMTATEYVTLENLLADVGCSLENLEQIKVVCEGSTSDISGDEIRSCKWYYDASGKQYEAPAAFAITHSSLSGTLEEVAAVAQANDDLRFGYGISEEQYKNKTEVGGRRLVSPVLNVELTMKEAAGGHILVTDYTAGSSKTENQTVTNNGTKITDTMLFSGETDILVKAADACVVAVENADGTYTRLYGTKVSGGYQFKVTVGTADVRLVVVKKGDVDLNGKIAGKDSSIIEKTAANKYTLTELKKLAGDIDANGRIVGKDASMISKMAAKKYTASWDVTK